MLLNPESDQEFLRETTERFLADRCPPATLRARRDDPAGFDPDVWRQGVELGWTALLVREEDGGGSVSGRGLVDLSLIAHEFGAAAAPGPFHPASLCTGAVSAAGGHGDLVADLLTGDAQASHAFTEGPGHDPTQGFATSITVDGGELVVSGEKRPVEAATTATHFIVAGCTDHGLTQVLVPADAPGVSIDPLTAVDLTRRFARVRFDDVRVDASAALGDPEAAGPAIERQLATAQAIAAAESVGAMQTAFAMTLEWTFDRYSFGRPLASYQALKHRCAEMAMWLEASHAITDQAIAEVQDGLPGASRTASAAKAYVDHYGSELMHDCVQLHGGIGVTFEHDLHLTLRRHTVNRALYGTAAQHRRRLGRLLAEGDAA